VACRFAGGDRWICALTELVVSAGGVRSHREDGLGSGSGADRVHLPPRGASSILAWYMMTGKLEALKATARRLAAGPGEHDLDLTAGASASLHTLTAADLLLPDLHEALSLIK
jgi:hypothetical protein